ncbi:DUF1349 domain-containing protein [Asticcacaulis sp. AND118]|uniref:DUF1349 domain-containing protein n=1 Tax=Asticcacaulis sp. AND118 TaxID=2840468 RepID=UPI001CFFE990|nr:DUF1349 domain-containing protein [Asticcacaulis sp. AND118]UDF04065.1 DUF1349 domain-containing protein [Asticcacaulis sp. AND118]
MKKIAAATLAVGLLAGGSSHAQDLGEKAISMRLPGIVFSRALNGAEKEAKVAGDVITLTSQAKRDNFRDPDGKLSNNTAPILLAEIDNTKPFTFVARVKPTFHETYDAGTLYLWARDDLWLKVAMERDERKSIRVVTVRTTGTSDDNNHDIAPASALYLKISSDTKTVGIYYSADQKTWQLVRLFKNDYPAKLWTGISTQSPVGDGTSAVFDSMALTKESIKDFRMGE